ncbi:uncharacterized protein B0P05DRAFT_156122 [Gilbertella persicaria]|uniref:uncharacterized protein n=1 Tax=Gilbertella persicaria TaxID=101096 RepID=UPI00221EC049|nr:uncharacterized protein B0P05DRAFT_156122 [Gilbertella persicaria]KAI8074269.1 hypothetical protein B0P05DRAFT_156122 [Gilbertella persicaria]
MTKLNAVPFHQKAYWESRFEREKHFEWLLTWDDVKPIIEPFIQEQQDILHLGCGNSELAFQIVDSGYTNTIVNVDYAENVIEHMKTVTQQRENPAYAGISWISGDCLNHLQSCLPQPEYAVLIDKSLVDTIACGDDDHQTRVKTLAKEMLSVAKPGAVWFSISFSGEREFLIDDASNAYWKTERKLPVEVNQPNDKPGAPAIYYYVYMNKKIVVY